MVDIRKVEIFDGKNNTWVEKAFSDLVVGDIIRIFEPDGERITITDEEGVANVFKVTSDVHTLDDKQAIEIESTTLPCIITGGKHE